MRKSKKKIILYVDPEKPPYVKIMYSLELENYEEWKEKIKKEKIEEY